MIKKLFQSLSEKAEIEYWLSSQKANLQNLLVFLVILSLPIQLGFHFWPDFSYIKGVRVDYLSPTFYFSDGLIILLLLSFSTRKNIKFIKSLVLKFIVDKKVMASLLIFALGIILSKNPSIGLYSLLKILEYSLLILVIAKNIQKNKFKIVLPALSIGILFESVLAILQFQAQASIGGLFYFAGERAFSISTPNIAVASIGGELVLRPYATFPHPNVLAGYLLISMLIVLLNLSSRIKDNSFYYLACFLGSVALILTMSRVAIFIWIIFLGFLFLGRVKIFLGALTGLVITFILFPQPIQRFIETSPGDQSFIQRLELGKASIGMIVEHPIFGVGIGNFLNNLTYYYKQTTQAILIQPVHNVPLLIVSQVGIIVSIILFYFYIILFKATNRLGKYLLFIVAIISLFDHYFLTLQQGQLVLCLVLGIAIAGMVRFTYGARRSI